MQGKKPEKGSAAMGIAGIGMAVVGIAWTAGAYSMTKDSPFGSAPSAVMTTFGIVFTLMAVLVAVKGFRGDRGREDNTGAGAENEELVNRIVGAVKESAQPREKAEKWICAYCRTTVDGESAFCPACGAGRKGKS